MSTVGRNQKMIEESVRNQLQEDDSEDPHTTKEFVDPFTGEPVKRASKEAL